MKIAYEVHEFKLKDFMKNYVLYKEEMNDRMTLPFDICTLKIVTVNNKTRQSFCPVFAYILIILYRKQNVRNSPIPFC